MLKHFFRGMALLQMLLLLFCRI